MQRCTPKKGAHLCKCSIANRMHCVHIIPTSFRVHLPPHPTGFYQAFPVNLKKCFFLNHSDFFSVGRTRYALVRWTLAIARAVSPYWIRYLKTEKKSIEIIHSFLNAFFATQKNDHIYHTLVAQTPEHQEIVPRSVSPPSLSLSNDVPIAKPVCPVHRWSHLKPKALTN